MMWYAKSAGDWFAANAWNSASDGSGDNATAPLPAADIADLNGKAMTTTNGATITQSLVQATTGTLTPTGTLVINGPVTYSGTATTGMVIVGTGASLAVNGKVSANTAGYAIVQSGSGTVTVNNGTGDALVTTIGRALSASGSGATHITGNLWCGTGYAWYQSSLSTAHTWTGNAFLTNWGSALYGVTSNGAVLTWTPAAVGPNLNTSFNGSSCILWQHGRLVINGPFTTARTSSGPLLLISGGTVDWCGNMALTTGANCEIFLIAGALNLVLQSSPYTPLVLTNSGNLVINCSSGTLNTTGNSGAVKAEINCQSGGHAVLLYATEAQKGIITYPSSGPIIRRVLRGSVIGGLLR